MNQKYRNEISTSLVYPERGGRMVLVDWATLYALIPDWIAHNKSRADGFRQWAACVAEIGRDESARQIEEAVAHIAACNQALDAALKSLGER